MIENWRRPLGGVVSDGRRDVLCGALGSDQPGQRHFHPVVDCRRHAYRLGLHPRSASSADEDRLKAGIRAAFPQEAAAQRPLSASLNAVEGVLDSPGVSQAD